MLVWMSSVMCKRPIQRQHYKTQALLLSHAYGRFSKMGIHHICCKHAIYNWYLENLENMNS